MRSNPKSAFVAGLIVWVVAAYLALRFGSVSDADAQIIFQLRLPRVLLGTAVGIALAVSGAVLQSVFSNPLCEPYTLGISSGGALGAVLGLSMGWELGVSGLVGSAFVGALVFALILYLISARPGVGGLSLLLSGVMLGFFGSSLVSVWMALADPEGLHGAIFWLMGALTRARPDGSVISLIIALVLTIAVWRHSRELDALMMGEEDAQSLGVSVRRARRRLLVLSSLLVGLAVSAAGMIGFLGLVVPHFVRRFTGSLHRGMLPVCAVWGAAALVLSDLVIRIGARPYELPVGVVTALVGAPLFFVFLNRRPDGGVA